jgi:hypothetical protein
MAKIFESKNWRALKKAIGWGSRRIFVESLTVAFCFPLVEAVLVNVWTGNQDPAAGIARNVLFAVAFLHLVLGGLLLADQRNSDMSALADAAETQEKLDEMTCELDRRTKAYGMVVSAVDEFNRRTCDIQPWCHDGFESGLKQIISHFTQNINVTLGVTTNKYTIEVHLTPGVIEAECGPKETCQGYNGLCMEFFYSPQVERTAPARLKNNSPVNLGTAKGVPCEQHVASDRRLFYDGDTLGADIYFRRFATLTFPWVCSPQFLGILVLTADQDEPFAGDAFETLRFMGSLIANYINAYNRCVYDYRIAQENKAAMATS